MRSDGKRICNVLPNFIQSLRLRWHRFLRAPSFPPYRKLNLGCGTNHLEGYLNIDADPRNIPDLCLTIANLKSAFIPLSFQEVLLIHVIGYLRLWEVRDLLNDVYSLLMLDGTFIIEGPDFEKLAKSIVGNPEDSEALRAVYGYDADHDKERVKYTVYHSGWTTAHLRRELFAAGFRKVDIKDPLTHGKRTWRDYRIEAIK
jgi:hypothetical protein